MSRTRIVRESDEAFVCIQCGMPVPPSEAGGRNRNHCRHCLASRHLDIRTGDRLSPCKGLMRPIAVWVKPDGEWSVLQRCERCGVIRANRVAADDDEGALLRLALKPVTRLPFPLEA